MFFARKFQNSNKFTPLILQSRNGHRLRGKAPSIARSLNKRLEDEYPEDKEITRQINIGFPALRSSRSAQLKERLTHVKAQRNNPELEKQARCGELLIDLKQVEIDSQKTTASHNLKLIAEHYGIYRDLFNDAFFIPRVPIDIKYQLSDDILVPVYNGNIIQPIESRSSPTVQFNGSVNPITKEKENETSYWTLIAVNPDCHLCSGTQEYLHWFISNIPNDDVQKGDTVASYIQPFPAKGLGYQRVVFILFKQNSKLTFEKFKTDPKSRLFNTRFFYEKYEDEITPAGLSFFQTCWDETLTEFYHNTLKMKEPVFAYNHPAPYRADQKWFPLKKPFNLYMDKYRDEKEINKEYLEKKLSKTHPFEGSDTPLKYPNAHYYEKSTPSWLQFELKKERLGLGRITKYNN